MERKFFLFLLFLIIMTVAIFLYKITTASIPDSTGFPILEYHMITSTPDETSKKYSVPPEIFDKQLDFLSSHGYNTITLKQLNSSELPLNPIVLTFDDGYSDNYSEMFPILKKHHMVAVIYVVSNLVGQPGYLTWQQIKEMESYGIEIGSHGSNHISVADLPIDKQIHEIVDSKKFIEYNGIESVTSFSYPNGKYDLHSLEIIAENYDTAVTGDAGLNNSTTDNRLMQRVNIPFPTFKHFAIIEFELRLKKCSAVHNLNILQHKQE